MSNLINFGNMSVELDQFGILLSQASDLDVDL